MDTRNKSGAISSIRAIEHLLTRSLFLAASGREVSRAVPVLREPKRSVRRRAPVRRSPDSGVSTAGGFMRHRLLASCAVMVAGTAPPAAAQHLTWGIKGGFVAGSVATAGPGAFEVSPDAGIAA